MSYRLDRTPPPIFQAGHAGSIPVARSAEYPLQQVYSIYCSTDCRQVPAAARMTFTRTFILFNMHFRTYLD
jgi:hypothetical protein